MKCNDSVYYSGEDDLCDPCILFDKFGKIIETRSCDVVNSKLPINLDPMRIPIASVRKLKPSKRPTYPSIGRIHIVVVISLFDGWVTVRVISTGRQMTFLARAENLRPKAVSLWQNSEVNFYL